jgi:hypothetical protein
MRKSTDRTMNLLAKACEAFIYGTFPPETVGARKMRERSRAPEVGDFVYIQFSFHHSPEATMGILREIIPGAMPIYRVETLSGKVSDWSNVQLFSIPMGDVFESSDEEKQWKPEAGL